MTDLVKTLNHKVGDPSSRHWLLLGQAITIGRKHVVRFMCDRVDGEFVPVFADEALNKAVQHFNIKDGHWIKLPVANGFMEIIPKALRVDSEGRPGAMLIELVRTPSRLGAV